MAYAVTPKNDPNRPRSDFYPTLDPNVTIALTRCLADDLGLLKLFSVVWEPACGEGHMAKALEGEGFPVIATTLEDMGYGDAFCDFLCVPLEPRCDWIITNPPFRLAGEFISRAHEHGKPFALLLKIQYWNAATRHPLFERCRPRYVMPLTWRPNFYPEERKTNAPTMDVMWCVWDGNDGGKTEFIPLRRPT